MMRPQATFKPGKHAYTLLAVLSAKKKPQNSSLDYAKNQRSLPLPITGKSTSLACSADASGREQSLKTFGNRPAQEFSDLITAGQLEVQVLESPTRDELLRTLEGLEPEIVYFQGEQATGTDEIGPLELNDCQISSPESLISLFGAKLPEVVYLESSCTSKLGEALHITGIPFVIFWKSSITYPLAAHFRHALIAVLRSSATQVWNAFQLASASFRFHCCHLKSQGIAYVQQKSNTMGPAILGDSFPNLKEPPNAMESGEGEGSPSASPAIKIHDNESELRLLVCAECHGQDSTAIGALEDGLNALLAVEVKGIRLLHRVSAPPPASAPSTLIRGVVTMRCELCTLSFARIPLFVSGSAQTCFDDQMLEYSIKKDILQKGELVSLVLAGGDMKSVVAPELRRSTSVACGTAVLEVKFRTPAWAIQVLRQLAPEISYRSLVALGVAGVQGFPVAAFQKEDAERLLSLKSTSLGKHDTPVTGVSGRGSFCQLPFWFNPAVPSRKRRRISDPGKFYFNDNLYFDEDMKSSGPSVHQQSGKSGNTSSSKPDLSLAAAMKPVPHANLNRNMPFVGAVLAGAQNSWAMKVTLPNGLGGKVVRPSSTFGPLGPNSSSGLPISQSRQTVRVPSGVQMLSLNPVPMKKHGCNRHPIHECSEEEFLKDVMHFLMSRGHSRLVPSTTVESFPDVILNGKRLDIYNLYREVVSRGGFYVGNGINWKGQVFSKMRNHTLINKMTGVGNTLKKHYETYLLEYELAHDDVAGECCILCHSCAAGDWVNCGVCGEWAHFGCDKRNGLGAFKDYAKTDGLEYICPRCSVSSGRGALGKKRIGSALGGYS